MFDLTVPHVNHGMVSGMPYKCNTATICARGAGDQCVFLFVQTSQ